MKRYSFKYMALALLAGLAMTACSPEDYEGADENGLPTIEGLDCTVSVDQTTNEVSMSVGQLPAGCYPVWFIDTNMDGTPDFYSTLANLTKIYSTRGTYSAELHVANRNGFSRAGLRKQFQVDNDLLDPTIITRLVGKEWRIDHAQPAHMACGQPGTDGTNWWRAAAEEKADMGLYDDRITFTAEGGYTYNPGEGGTVFVNTGSGLFNEFNTNNGSDYMAQVQTQQSTYKVVMDGEQKFLVLADKTLFPYLSTADQYEHPRFRIEDLTSRKMVLVYDNGSIAWHFILTSTDDVVTTPTFSGYKYDSNCNMWKSMHYTNDFFYVNGNDWTTNPNPIGFADNGSGSYTITLPDASSQLWQAQVKFFTDMTSNAATRYDFSLKIEASKDVKGATIKLVNHDDVNNYFFEDHVDLAGRDEVVFYKDNLKGIDMANVDLVLDFGGNPAGTTVRVSDVVFKEHDCDDGAGHPAPPPTEDNTPYIYDTPNNLWKTVDATDCEMFFNYTDGSWAPYAEHQGFKHEGNVYTLTFPQPTVQQWQNQVAFYTPLSCAKGDTFDFGCVMTPNVDLTNVTIKLVKHGKANDGIFFFAKQVNLTGGEDNVIKFPAQVAPNDMDTIDLYLDFGGNPANTEVIVKDIVLKKTE